MRVQARMHAAHVCIQRVRALSQCARPQHVLTMQTDLRVETVHLRRFYNNFASVRSSVTPPLPLPGMDTEAVLVETYEAGECYFTIIPDLHRQVSSGLV